ncbi:MAG: hypothetical protein AAB884_02025 [Patescibacteria group bacterium]
MKAFSFIDDILKNGVKAIAELINVPGIINVDFADIRTILKDAGPTLIGIGMASGADRSIKAVDAAINSPLLELSIDGAKGVLFSIAGGRDLKMSEINDVAKAVSANLDTNVRVIFGAYHDKSLKEKNMKVTVIATGFNGIFNGSRLGSNSLFGGVFPKNDIGATAKIVENNGNGPVTDEENNGKPGKSEKTKSELWEVPAFLRKKKR